MSNPDPIQILQTLVRFDTTNPPGNEYLAINWARETLAQAGIESTILAKDPKRPNLIARIKGRGESPPLLLQGHVDVVTTRGQQWDHPPFDGDISDGFVWGRGTLDMKGAVAMMMSAFLQAHQSKAAIPGDVILCLLADEEAGGDVGAKFLVDEHPEQFEGVEFALGEAGGFSLGIAGKVFYPIMVAEKQMCWMKITLHGPGGHGSMIHRGGTMAQLAKLLTTLEKNTLPIHITPPVREMFNGIVSALSFPARAIMRTLLNPTINPVTIRLLGSSGRLFEPLFHNTVNATIVRGGDKVNVIPSEITLELDGRLLPGFTPDLMQSEITALLGSGFDLEILRYEPGPVEANMRNFQTLVEIMKEADPNGFPIPFVMIGVTDARHFSRLGIQTYGFTPMKLPASFNFASLAHGANERIPVDALAFGTRAIYQAMERF